MCGINALFGFEFTKSDIAIMNGKLVHRGPDGQGIFDGDGYYLGHTRLSIIDLSPGGSQPMTVNHENREVVVTFNGEIYNYVELRNELEQKGYSFSTSSDTEVLAVGYLEYGEGLTERLRGMWAFVIVDKDNNRIMISRDPVGKKPVYYHESQNKIIVSSQLHAITSVLKDKPTLETKSIELFFALGFIPSPDTIYSQVKKLKPGEIRLYDKTELTLIKSWSHRFAFTITQKLNAADIQNLLKESVDLRLRSDVEVSSYLSGGVDSALISSIAAKKLTNAYTLKFKEGNDETNLAKSSAKYLGLTHKVVTFPEIETLLEEYSDCFDEPFADPGGFSLLSLAARTKEKVVLTGDGGDEIFGGYPRHKRIARIALLRKIGVLWIFRASLKIIALVKPSRTMLRLNYVMSSPKGEEDLRLFVPVGLATENVTKWFKDTYSELDTLINQRFSVQDKGVLHDLLFKTVPDNFLVKADRASMFHSVELRNPLLDRVIIERVWSMRFTRANLFGSKKMIRRYFEDNLSEEVKSNKSKYGFSPPIYSWMNRNSNKDNILKESSVANMVPANLRNAISNSSDKVVEFRLLVFSQWIKKYVNENSSTDNINK